MECKICNNKTNTYKYICDECAEKQEIKPFGRYCEYCGIDLFNEENHKKNCPDAD